MTLTEWAAARVKDKLARRGGPAGILLGVKRAGRSALAYVIDYDNNSSSDCMVFENRELQVSLESERLKLIDGAMVDSVKQGLNEGVRFRNLNFKDKRGCRAGFSRRLYARASGLKIFRYATR